MLTCSLVLDYLSFQGDVNDPDAADDLIEELGALKVVRLFLTPLPCSRAHRSVQKLQGLDFDQSSDFGALKSSFQQLGRNLATAVQDRDTVVQSEVDAAQATVSALEKQLQE